MDFDVVLVPQTEGGYTVTVPALPGCVTEGDSFEESLAMARDAIAGYLATWGPPLGQVRLAKVTVEA